MATTTNFGWETPDDTDLVKDGAAAMRTLGSAIDTSFVDLKGGTTGQILSKASNTDLDYTWITNDVGDITAVTAGTGLSGGGTSGAVTLSIDTATTVDLSTAQTLTNKTLTSPVLTTPTISTVDAKGDLLAGTADNTIGRLAVGTNGQILTADSSTATGLKWASAAGGGGKVLQVVQATTNTPTTTNSTSFTDTGLSASITPSATTSKIMVLVTQQFGLQVISSSQNVGMGFRIMRGATSVLESPVNSASYADYSNTGYIVNRNYIAMNYLDSPSTTSSTTYKTQGNLNSTANSRDLTYQNSNAYSTILLIEIGA